ncbi:hypothetical protein [Gordonia sp. KTR9]|uniref:hypothetical protein n=1 Tax=Gordonia sp. KTR9 TaxID=337191 RepID=UPI0011D1B680|nr:hypothetical protein [Gordonia sp. KTR9]
MLIVLGLVAWLTIGAALGLMVGSQAFAQGWSDAAPAEPHSGPRLQKEVADDRNGRRLLMVSTVTAVVTGLISMVVLIGETLVGLLISLPAAAIGAAAALLIMSAVGSAADGDGSVDDQMPLDQ